jgi:hypothetical protein
VTTWLFLLKNIAMPKSILSIIVAFLLMAPLFGDAQRRKVQPPPPPKDTVAVAVPVAVVPVAAKDSVVVVIDSPKVVVAADTAVVVTPKDCYQEWYEKMRARGANPVTDGMHPVVITLKSESSGVCMMGKIQVTNGKIVPPVLVQQEDGEYIAANLMGKKLDPGFAGTMSADELYKITDGMSILFRTASQEYGRLLFYTFAKKDGTANKIAPSPDELIKD